METKLFRNQHQLFTYLDGISEGLDLDKTFKLPYFWFSDGTTEYKCESVKLFCVRFNEVFGTSLNSEHSYRHGKKCMIYFESTDVVEEVTEVVEPEVVPEEPIVEASQVEVVVEEVTSEVEPTVEEDSSPLEVVEQVSTSVKDAPDWDWINSLDGSNKYDKKDFDEYAEQKYNIKLSRRNTLENMIIMFKEELAKL